MSTRDRNHGLSDELLTAFIDGELGADEAARVEALIGADPSVAERFDQLSRADLPYAAAFEPLLDAAPGDRLEAMLASIPPVKASHRFTAAIGRRGFLAAAAACVIAGIAIDRAVIGVDRRLNQPGEGAEWRAVVADYVALYSPDTLSAPAGDRAAQLAELDRVGSKIGLSSAPRPSLFPVPISVELKCCNTTANRWPRSPISTRRTARWRCVSSNLQALPQDLKRNAVTA